jgi:hypothetical protein
MPTLAEWKLLKLLQQQINLHTERLQQALESLGKPTAEQARRYDQLSEEQGHLAGIAGRSPGAKEEQESPLREIARQMRQSQQRLSQNDSGAVTQSLQGRIVADLDRLIEQARQIGKSSLSGANQPQAAATGASGGPLPSKAGSSGQQTGGSNPAGASATRPSDDGKVRKADVEAMRAAVKQHWGELPERARQQMLQPPMEDFPPKYQLLIEEYFRRLSEEKGGR